MCPDRSDPRAARRQPGHLLHGGVHLLAGAPGRTRDGGAHRGAVRVGASGAAHRLRGVGNRGLSGTARRSDLPARSTRVSGARGTRTGRTLLHRSVHSCGTGEAHDCHSSTAVRTPVEKQRCRSPQACPQVGRVRRWSRTLVHHREHRPVCCSVHRCASLTTDLWLPTRVQSTGGRDASAPCSTAADDHPATRPSGLAAPPAPRPTKKRPNAIVAGASGAGGPGHRGAVKEWADRRTDENEGPAADAQRLQDPE